MGKRLISLLLAVVLVLSLAGLTTAFAVEGDSTEEYTVTDETEDTATQTTSSDDSSSGSESENSTDESTGLTSTASVISDDTTDTETETVLSADEVQALIDALPTVEDLSAMTSEEQLEVYYATQEANDAYYALSEEDQALVDDSVLDELFAYFNSLTEEVPDPPSTTSTIKVYYDTISTTVTNGEVTAATALNSTAGISSVTISGGNATNNGTVAHENGTASSGWNTTTTEITHTSNSSDTVSITITPAAGYYVTYVTICCTTSGAPLRCNTWNNDSAYEGTYTIDNAGAVTFSVGLSATAGFYHNGSTNPYFILIAVAKIPSPLYVEYDYGTIVSSLTADNYSATYFTDSASGWTTANSGNSYGSTGSGDSSTNGVMTSDTQYKYTYADDSNSGSAGWVHKANSITDEALAQAAADGYYFVGWLATYYTTCTATSTSGSYNNYSYAFSGEYGSTTDYYQPGNSVTLTVHVKLVAQWVKVNPTPGELTITKTFSGLETSECPESITVTIYNSSGTQVGEVTLNSDNEWTATLSGLNPGTYTVTESGYDVSGYTDAATSTTTVNGTTTNGSGYSTTVTLGYESDKTLNTTTNTYTYTVTTYDGSVAFTNTYTKAYTTITITKDVTGNMGDTSKEFDFTLTLTDYTDSLSATKYDSSADSTSSPTLTNSSTTSSGSYSFTLADGDYITITVPVDNAYTVTESTYSDYKTYINDFTTTATTTSGTTTSNGVSIAYTNDKDVTPDTGVTLTSLPYLLILTASLSGLGLVLINKKRRDGNG
ncbi:MAG: Cna B-type domain-containing protein [Oscillospiraceae bacterium]|nr:Cna B-type domain-containing protein [Oscillospiraceae bacterium]